MWLVAPAAVWLSCGDCGTSSQRSWYRRPALKPVSRGSSGSGTCPSGTRHAERLSAVRWRRRAVSSVQVSTAADCRSTGRQSWSLNASVELKRNTSTAYCRIQTWRYHRCIALGLWKSLVKNVCQRFSHTTVHTKEDHGALQKKNKNICGHSVIILTDWWTLCRTAATFPIYWTIVQLSSLKFISLEFFGM